MAASDDKAAMTLSAALLPLEMRKTLSSLSMEYTPANNSEAWYSKLTTVSTSNKDLFVANAFATSPTAGGSGTYGSTRSGADTTNVINTITIANDLVKFLFIQHLSLRDDGTTGNTADSIYLTVDGSAPACTDALSIEIGPGESWYCKMNVPATNIHVTSDPKAFASHDTSQTIQCYVAAIISDVG